MFKRGDRVQLQPENQRWPLRRGRYLGLSRDGKYDRVRWDGAAKPRVIGRGYIEPEEPAAVDAGDLIKARDLADREEPDRT